MSVIYGAGQYRWVSGGPLVVRITEEAAHDTFSVYDFAAPLNPGGAPGYGTFQMYMPPTTLSGLGLPLSFQAGDGSFSNACATGTGFPSWTAPPGIVGWESRFHLSWISVVPAPGPAPALLAGLLAVSRRRRTPVAAPGTKPARRPTLRTHLLNLESRLSNLESRISDLGSRLSSPDLAPSPPLLPPASGRLSRRPKGPPASVSLGIPASSSTASTTSPPVWPSSTPTSSSPCDGGRPGEMYRRAPPPEHEPSEMAASSPSPCRSRRTRRGQARLLRALMQAPMMQGRLSPPVRSGTLTALNR